MNTTICDGLPWYKIGKFFLHTQKEKHSNGLEDRPSFSQVGKGVLWKNQNKMSYVLHKINILLGKSISSTLLMYCQNVTHAFRRCLLQSHQCIGMRMNQDPSLCMFRHFYRDVIYRGSLRKRNIMIGRVVVHYGWKISSRKLCG